MSGLCTGPASKKPAIHFRHSYSGSTVAPEHDADWGACDSCDELDECPCGVVVKATFLDVDEGQSLMERFANQRGRTMSDSALVLTSERREPYVPGQFSERPAVPQQVRQPQQERLVQSPVRPKPQLPEKRKSNSAKKALPKTTVMLRNLPNNYTREMLIHLLDDKGFAGRYDFVYLPCDFRRQANLGYAFVNLVDASAVDAAWATFDGFEGWVLPSQKVCQVKWSGPHQGLEAHVERYRNSPVMHKSVPDYFKPVIFNGGVRKSFPKPTRKIKMPTVESVI